MKQLLITWLCIKGNLTHSIYVHLNTSGALILYNLVMSVNLHRIGLS